MERNHGIDALRIVSILFVVTLHIMYHGGVLPALDSADDLNYRVGWFVETVAYCAVDCFMLISGYVLAKARFASRRIISLWLEAFFYSALIAIIVNAMNPGSLKEDVFIWSFFPVLGNRWWFFTVYFALACFSPFLNILLKQLTAKQAGILLVLCFAMMTVAPLVSGQNIFSVNNGYSLLWFFVLYLMGGCLRIRQDQRAAMGKRKFLYLLGFFALAGVTCVLAVSGHYRMFTEPWMIQRASLVLEYTSPFVLGCALLLFGFFSNLRISTKRGGAVISWISSHVFAVYLISDNVLLRTIFTEGAYKSFALMDPGMMVLSIFGVVLATFAACLLIDVVRKGLFWLLRINKAVEKLGSFLDAKLLR